MIRPDHNSSPARKAMGRRVGLNRGLALLAVLWILSLLALMAATFTRTTRTEVNLARNAMEQLRAEALAETGVYLAATRLQQPIEQGGWSIDGRVRHLQREDGEVRILVVDEAGKIDLNGAGADLLQALFRALGAGSAESADLAESVVDFRDADHLSLRNGAEDQHYLAAGLSHDAKDAPFEDVAELQQVMGMTPALYRRAAPVLTVYTHRRQPNEATAPPLVVAALLGQVMEESEADGDAAAQAGQAGGGAPDQGGGAGSEAASEGSELGGLRSRLSLYEIHAEGRTRDGAVFARQAIVLLVPSRERAFRVLSWRRGERRLFEATRSDLSPVQESQ